MSIHGGLEHVALLQTCTISICASNLKINLIIRNNVPTTCTIHNLDTL